MAERDSDREAAVELFEREAEVIAAHQLDLLAQMEAQLRAVHRLLRGIEKLRAARHRVGPQLTNGERGTTLTTLGSEITAIDTELNTQHHTCLDMQHSIREMQHRLAALRKLASLPAEPHPASEGRR